MGWRHKPIPGSAKCVVPNGWFEYSFDSVSSLGQCPDRMVRIRLVYNCFTVKPSEAMSAVLEQNSKLGLQVQTLAVKIWQHTLSASWNKIVMSPHGSFLKLEISDYGYSGLFSKFSTLVYLLNNFSGWFPYNFSLNTFTTISQPFLTSKVFLRCKL